jgi:hypothetical protein
MRKLLTAPLLSRIVSLAQDRISAKRMRCGTRQRNSASLNKVLPLLSIDTPGSDDVTSPPSIRILFTIDSIEIAARSSGSAGDWRVH